MKSKFVFFYLLVLMLVFSKPIYAQNSKTIDTVNYLADTAKVPLKDRLVGIGVEGPFKYFAIRCACLDYNQNPVFVSKTIDQGELINIVSLKKIQLISLSNLILLAKDGGGNAFNYKHVAYILEPFGNSYIKRKVILSKPMRQDIRY